VFGPALREARLKKGWSQARLARESGVSRNHIAAIEKGANTSLETVRKLAALLDLREVPYGEEGDLVDVAATAQRRKVLVRARSLISRISRDVTELESVLYERAAAGQQDDWVADLERRLLRLDPAQRSAFFDRLPALAERGADAARAPSLLLSRSTPGDALKLPGPRGFRAVDFSYPAMDQRSSRWKATVVSESMGDVLPRGVEIVLDPAQTPTTGSLVAAYSSSTGSVIGFAARGEAGQPRLVRTNAPAVNLSTDRFIIYATALLNDVWEGMVS
jgi:transcriptional regulator with XRE-family HTH domain